jgi:hypothetical protein
MYAQSTLRFLRAADTQPAFARYGFAEVLGRKPQRQRRSRTFYFSRRPQIA